VSRHEWHEGADVQLSLVSGLPLVPCHLGQVSQALLNILVNAGHALRDRAQACGRRGTIRISTQRDGEWVEIRIADDGPGIPEAIRTRVFDPFFTTKEVGHGTGQGLAIARSVIVEKHGGELRFESAVGRGTTFFVRLPLVAPERGVVRGEPECGQETDSRVGRRAARRGRAKFISWAAAARRR
jgi:signal transduction histidine kinase